MGSRMGSRMSNNSSRLSSQSKEAPPSSGGSSKGDQEPELFTEEQLQRRMISMLEKKTKDFKQAKKRGDRAVGIVQSVAQKSQERHAHRDGDERHALNATVVQKQAGYEGNEAVPTPLSANNLEAHNEAHNGRKDSGSTRTKSAASSERRRGVSGTRPTWWSRLPH